MTNTTKKRPLASDGENTLLKMKELVDATGVAKSTILHYVNEGLLPKPVKTSSNMAYYEQVCIEKIIYIKNLQSKHRLSLGQIKIVLKEQEKNSDAEPLLLELWDVVFDKTASEKLNQADYCKLTGLSQEEVEEFVTLGLLMPKKENYFDSEDVAIGIVFRKSIDLGLKPEDAMFYKRNAEKIVKAEMAIQKRITKNQSHDNRIASAIELTRIARSLRAYIIDRQFQMMAMKRVNSTGKKGQ